MASSPSRYRRARSMWRLSRSSPRRPSARMLLASRVGSERAAHNRPGQRIGEGLGFETVHSPRVQSVGLRDATKPPGGVAPGGGRSLARLLIALPLLHAAHV